MVAIGQAKKKFTFVSQHFPPEPVALPLNFAKILKQIALDVNVICSVPNYPSGIVHSDFAAYRFKRTSCSGMTVTYCPVFPSHDESVLRRLLTYFSFTLSSMFLVFRSTLRVDAVFVYGSPLTAAIPTFLSSQITRTPYVIYATDLWPEAITASSNSFRMLNHGFISRFNNWWTLMVYKHASFVIVINNDSKFALQSRGVSESKIRIISPWVEEECDLNKSELQKRNVGTLTYVGNLGEMQNLGLLIEAFSRTENQKLKLVIAGAGTQEDSLKKLAQTIGDQRISILGQVTQFQASELIARADVAIVSLGASPQLDIAVPSKLQFAMVRETPILGICSGATRQLIEEAECGWVVTQTSAADIAKQIDSIFASTLTDRREKGINGAVFYKSHLSKTIATTVLDDIVQKLWLKEK